MIGFIRDHRIIILDFGSQYTQLIARRVRELGVYCELFKWNVTKEEIEQFKPSGIILSGGPESITKINSPRASQYIFKANIPVLGICYGMQIMVVQLGGRVKLSKRREFGYAQVEIQKHSNIISDLADSLTNDGKVLLNVWMSHNDMVTSIPKGFDVIARTENCPFAIVTNEEKHFYGIQFHPEVTHTTQGVGIFKNFVYNICRCKPLWTPSKIIDDIVFRIRKKIGNDKIILGISGGLDSTVTAFLLHKAISKNLICIFINNGLLYFNESKLVINKLIDKLGIDVVFIDSEKRFFEALKEESDPESKRKIIGRLFIKIFNEEAVKIGNIKWLAQGTIYSDVIESASFVAGKKNVIKSHHNVGALPDNMKMSLIEPLRELFKDEVRDIAQELGINHDMIYNHPFPGPGLGIRILGKIKREYCDLLRHADSIFTEELRKNNLFDKVSQAFAVFLPIRSVGVMGDKRKYGWVISLRVIETIDFMTAQWVYLPYEFLNKVSNRIISEINGISRVVYDISSKPPATIEWE